MFGQHRGDVIAKERGVVQILDVGAVDTEDVADTNRREVLDDVVDDSMPGHLLTCPYARRASAHRTFALLHR